MASHQEVWNYLMGAGLIQWKDNGARGSVVAEVSKLGVLGAVHARRLVSSFYHYLTANKALNKPTGDTYVLNSVLDGAEVG